MVIMTIKFKKKSNKITSWTLTDILLFIFLFVILWQGCPCGGCVLLDIQVASIMWPFETSRFSLQSGRTNGPNFIFLFVFHFLILWGGCVLLAFQAASFIWPVGKKITVETTFTLENICVEILQLLKFQKSHAHRLQLHHLCCWCLWFLHIVQCLVRLFHHPCSREECVE